MGNLTARLLLQSFQVNAKLSYFKAIEKWYYHGSFGPLQPLDSIFGFGLSLSSVKRSGGLIRMFYSSGIVTIEPKFRESTLCFFGL